MRNTTEKTTTKKLDETKATCGIKICEDPKTGRLIAVREGSCPEGMRERLITKLKRDGVDVAPLYD